eukprot:TRINITY_DN5346_c1_g2_i1.p1 TRINITY_DN5346_c1_g2~~TRINITY_DN5346_c1_g2_i1.p1  ORF type:complete len:391 (-),score=81.53 TRINITY_DN5346_c1_g2_i1:236-1357(-)
MEPSRGGSAVSRSGSQPPQSARSAASFAPLTARESRRSNASVDSLSQLGAESSYGPSMAGGRLDPIGPKENSQQLSKKEFEKARKRKEAQLKMEKLNLLRQQDEVLIKEKAARLQRQMDERCEAKLREILGSEGCKAEAQQIVGSWEERKNKKQQDMYSKWDAEVSQRVEHQVLKFHLPVPPPEPSHFKGRARLLKGDDPLKSSLRQQEDEQGFLRAADHILNTPREGNVAELVQRRKLIQESVAQRSNTRPMLPVQMWEQRQHYASSLGYFVQSCERGGPHHCARRQGTEAHRIDESDGVEAAGKTKTRWERNRLGMLTGTVAKEGESAQHKTTHGRSSAAPMQDHYHYEQGNDAVEREMPAHKRLYPMLRA